jgi:hypothetical protein
MSINKEREQDAAVMPDKMLHKRVRDIPVGQSAFVAPEHLHVDDRTHRCYVEGDAICLPENRAQVNLILTRVPGGFDVEIPEEMLFTPERVSFHVLVRNSLWPIVSVATY